MCPGSCFLPHPIDAVIHPIDAVIHPIDAMIQKQANSFILRKSGLPRQDRPDVKLLKQTGTLEGWH